MRDAAVPLPEGWENAGMLLDQPLSPWRLSVAPMTDRRIEAGEGGKAGISFGIKDKGATPLDVTP